MIKVINDSTISYTKNDTFNWTLPIVGAEEDSQIVFIIAEKDTDDSEDNYIVNNSYPVYNANSVTLILMQEDRSKLLIGDYYYKMIYVRPTGERTTIQSGQFNVKWGA